MGGGGAQLPRGLYREISDRDIFCADRARIRRGLHKKTEVRYFSVHTEQARLIKSLLYGIYTRNKQEMNDLKCILVAWYTFG